MNSKFETHEPKYQYSHQAIYEYSTHLNPNTFSHF